MGHGWSRKGEETDIVMTAETIHQGRAGSHLDPVSSSSVSHQYRSVAKNLRGLSRVKWIKSFLLRISAFSWNKFVILMINDDNDGTRASDGRGAGKTKRRDDQVRSAQKAHIDI